MADPCNLRDVARACGVSVSSVSKALRNQGNLAPATRKRIHDQAERLGYRPKPAIAAIAAKHFRSQHVVDALPIAYLFSHPEQEWSNAEHHVPSARARAAQLGYRLELINLWGDGKALRAVLGQLYHRGVAGIILGEIHQDVPAWEKFDWSPFAVVSLGHDGPRTPFHTVAGNTIGGVNRCWDEVVRRGFQRIGVVILKHDRSIDDDARLGAVWVCQSKLAATAQHIPPFRRPGTDCAGFVRWFQEHRPDAVIGFTAGHYHDLTRSGVARPGDFAFCCMHVIPGRQGYENIAGVINHAHDTAAMAVELIDRQIRYRELGIPSAPAEWLAPVRWIDGTSLG